MTYPGNDSLAEEIRGRILNTFRQTLELAESGNLAEAQLGCDFVLRLDPLFEPARTLHERLQGKEGPVPVADLRSQLGEGAAPAPPQAAPDPTGSLDPVMPPAAEAAPAAGAASTDDAPVLEIDLEEDSGPLGAALDLSSLESKPAETPSAPPAPAAPESPAEAPAPSGGEPIAELDTESEKRVQDLLDEGQVAFEKAQYQSAIDAWSRIFLIDIDHAEANRRIDLARKLKAEVERKVEETYHDALTKLEGGQLDQARAGFQSVLEMMPGHLSAQEYLERLDAPDFVPPEQTATAPPTPPPAPGEFDDSYESPGEFSEVLTDGVLDSGVADEVDPAPRPAIGGVGRASKPPAKNKTFKTVGLVSLLVLAVVGYFLYQNWDKVFPNANDNAAVPVQLDPITRAKRTHAEAGAAIAIAQLRRLSPGHPQYAEAQALLAQWEAALDASKPETDDTDPEVLAARDRLVAEARIAVEEQRYLRTRDLLNSAASYAPLDDDGEQLLRTAESELDPLRTEITMVEEGEWEFALRSLWRLWEGDSPTPDVRELMVDSYYNLGVRDLQRNDLTSAVANLEEAVDLAGEDEQLARVIDFARTYESRPEDLLYRIFVKYLPFR